MRAVQAVQRLTPELDLLQTLSRELRATQPKALEAKRIESLTQAMRDEEEKTRAVYKTNFPEHIPLGITSDMRQMIINTLGSVEGSVEEQERIARHVISVLLSIPVDDPLERHLVRLFDLQKRKDLNILHPHEFESLASFAEGAGIPIQKFIRFDVKNRDAIRTLIRIIIYKEWYKKEFGQKERDYFVRMMRSLNPDYSYDPNKKDDPLNDITIGINNPNGDQLDVAGHAYGITVYIRRLKDPLDRAFTLFEETTHMMTLDRQPKSFSPTDHNDSYEELITKAYVLLSAEKAGIPISNAYRQRDAMETAVRELATILKELKVRDQVGVFKFFKWDEKNDWFLGLSGREKLDYILDYYLRIHRGIGRALFDHFEKVHDGAYLVNELDSPNLLALFKFESRKLAIIPRYRFFTFTRPLGALWTQYTRFIDSILDSVGLAFESIINKRNTRSTGTSTTSLGTGVAVKEQDKPEVTTTPHVAREKNTAFQLETEVWAMGEKARPPVLDYYGTPGILGTNEQSDGALFRTVRESTEAPDGYIIGPTVGNIFTMLEFFPDGVTPKGIAIVDINPLVILFGRIFREMLAVHESYDSFEQSIKSLDEVLKYRDIVLANEKDPYVQERLRAVPIEDIKEHVIENRYYSYMVTDDPFSSQYTQSIHARVEVGSVMKRNFSRLRQLAVENNIAVVLGDFLNPDLHKAINDLPGITESRNIIYTSNVVDIITERSQKMSRTSLMDGLQEIKGFPYNYIVDTTAADDYRLSLHKRMPSYKVDWSKGYARLMFDDETLADDEAFLDNLTRSKSPLQRDTEPISNQVGKANPKGFTGVVEGCLSDSGLVSTVYADSTEKKDETAGSTCPWFLRAPWKVIRRASVGLGVTEALVRAWIWGIYNLGRNNKLPDKKTFNMMTRGLNCSMQRCEEGCGGGYECNATSGCCEGTDYTDTVCSTNGNAEIHRTLAKGNHFYNREEINICDDRGCLNGKCLGYRQNADGLPNCSSFDIKYIVDYSS